MRQDALTLLLCTLCSLVLLWPLLSTPGWPDGRMPALIQAPLPVPSFADPVAAAKLALWGLMILGGIGAYRLAHCFCRPSTALATAVLFYLTPWLATLLYERGALPELTAMLLMPWPFYHLIIMSRRVRHNSHALSNALWMSLGLTAIVFAHPVSAAWFALAFAVCALGRAFDTPTFWHVLMITILSFVLAAALSFPFWLPAAEMKLWPLGDSASSSLPSMLQLFALDSGWLGPILPLLAFLGFCIGIHAYMMAATLMCLGVLLATLTPLLSLLPVLRDWPMTECALAVLATVQLIGIAFFFGYAEWRQRWRFGWAVVLTVAAVLAFDNQKHYPLGGMSGFAMPTLESGFKEKPLPTKTPAAMAQTDQQSGLAVTAGALSLLLLWGLCRPRQFHPMNT